MVLSCSLEEIVVNIEKCHHLSPVGPVRIPGLSLDLWRPQKTNSRTEGLRPWGCEVVWVASSQLLRHI